MEKPYDPSQILEIKSPLRKKTLSSLSSPEMPKLVIRKSKATDRSGIRVPQRKSPLRSPSDEKKSPNKSVGSPKKSVGSPSKKSTKSVSSPKKSVSSPKKVIPSSPKKSVSSPKKKAIPPKITPKKKPSSPKKVSPKKVKQPLPKIDKKSPYTHKECKKWKENPLVNPRTNRAIQKGKISWKELEKDCGKLVPSSPSRSSSGESSSSEDSTEEEDEIHRKSGKRQDKLSIKQRLQFKITLGKQSIELSEKQEEHVKELEAIYDPRTPVVSSNSETGAGKTYISSSLFLRLGIPNMLVIGPASSKNSWIEFTARYGGINPMFISFQSLAGREDKQPKHGLLLRTDDVSTPVPRGESRKYDKTYQPSIHLIKMLKEGLFVIIDEYQGIRNSSDQSNATLAIMKTMHAVNEDKKVGKNGELEITPTQRKSRAIFLSATPFQAEESCIRIMRAMGVIQRTKLFGVDIRNPKNGNVFLGFQDLLDNCKYLHSRFNLEGPTVESIMKNYNIAPVKDNKGIMIKAAIDLYREIVLPSISRSLTKPASEAGITHRISYMLTEFDDEAKTSYNMIISVAKSLQRLLAAAIALRDQDMINAMRGAIIRSLVAIEMIKVSVIAAEAIKVLENNPNAKVLLMMNFNVPVVALQEKLKKYKPLILNGSTSKNKMNIIRCFQEPNTKYRVIISNINSGGVSASFHDEDGRFPRTMYISPRYSAIEMVQAFGRINRYGTKSSTDTFIVYGPQPGVIREYVEHRTMGKELKERSDQEFVNYITEEHNISQSIQRKGKVIRDNLQGKYKETAILTDNIRQVEISTKGTSDMEEFEGFTRRIIGYLGQLYQRGAGQVVKQQYKNAIQREMDEYKDRLDIETSLNVESNYIRGENEKQEEEEEEEEEDLVSSRISSPRFSPRELSDEEEGDYIDYIKYPFPSKVTYDYIPIPRWEEMFGKGERITL